MDFDLSEEQRLLKESVDGLLTDSYDFDARKKYMKEKGGWSRAVWSKLAEQGLLGLPFSEADGGFGGGGVETMIVMEALGKALVLEPYLATVVIGGGFLRHAGTDAQKAAHVPGIIDGSKTLAFAQLEKNSRYDLFDVTTSAKKKGDGWVIDGEKFVVLNGENADTLVVTARTKGDRRDKTGIAIGSFQSLQHRASDMFVAAEQARSMSMFATMASDFQDAKERSNAIAAAKVQIGKSLKFVGQQSIQLHGGIGMTMEAKIGHYFKRLTMIENTFGDTDYHLRRVSDAGGLV